MWYVPPAQRTTILTNSDHPTPLEARSSGPLAGKARVPGDKSISHRALILGALAVGRTRIDGLLEGEDVLCTAAAMRALGAGAGRGGDQSADRRLHRRRLAAQAADGAGVDAAAAHGRPHLRPRRRPAPPH